MVVPIENVSSFYFIVIPNYNLYKLFHIHNYVFNTVSMFELCIFMLFIFFSINL